MTLSKLDSTHFEGGGKLNNFSDTGDGVKSLFNKLIELVQTWHKTLASAFTTAADAGAWEDVTGMSQSVTLTEDSCEINARVDLEFESAGTAAAILKARMVIGSDAGETFTVDIPNAITDSIGLSVAHSFTGVKGTSYTVKLQVADDGTTAQTVSIVTMDVSLGATLG